MTLARSKITAQGQVSVPAEVRRKLGIGPGSVLEWDQEGEQIVVRRSGRFTSEEIHRAVFPSRTPKRRSLAALKAAIGKSVKARHARH
ncbi:MAG: AbrB/MazE/SpoVT family DNA-binding domain-containing protein [Acidobacteria bacterium]|nr:AbrB/MazE/SpoVT family DNA-binding domain-containing protein [Acidobacteriota bacterium]